MAWDDQMRGNLVLPSSAAMGHMCGRSAVYIKMDAPSEWLELAQFIMFRNSDMQAE